MEPLRLFTPGPVPIEPHLLAIGRSQPPYNRTPEFSAFTHEILDGLQYVFQTTGPVALLTSSGTAAMEAAVLNFLGPDDRALIINGGTFGQRWCDLCRVHSIPYDEISVPPGHDIDITDLRYRLLGDRYSALLVNAHETSSGHLYDIQAIGNIARASGTFFIVDAISTICADPFPMDDWHIDVAVLSSQKALALPPGLSFVAMGRKAELRMRRTTPKSLYFDLAGCLDNQLRGQLPYTPAIGLMLQLHQRLADIRSQTLPALVATHRDRATSFREAIQNLPFTPFPARPSNAMTALSCIALDAPAVVESLRRRHQIIVAPGSGTLKPNVIRIAHMGAQTDADQAVLVSALTESAGKLSERNTYESDHHGGRDRLEAQADQRR